MEKKGSKHVGGGILVKEMKRKIEEDIVSDSQGEESNLKRSQVSDGLFCPLVSVGAGIQPR